MFNQGTVTHSLWRGVLVFAVFAIQGVLSQNPEWGTITIGSLAFAAVHYIEGKLTK